MEISKDNFKTNNDTTFQTIKYVFQNINKQLPKNFDEKYIYQGKILIDNFKIDDNLNDPKEIFSENFINEYNNLFNDFYEIYLELNSMNFDKNSRLDYEFSVILFEFSYKYILTYQNEINQEIDDYNIKMCENEYVNVIVNLINFLGSITYHQEMFLDKLIEDSYIKNMIRFLLNYNKKIKINIHYAFYNIFDFFIMHDSPKYNLCIATYNLFNLFEIYFKEKKNEFHFLSYIFRTISNCLCCELEQYNNLIYYHKTFLSNLIDYYDIITDKAVMREYIICIMNLTINKNLNQLRNFYNRNPFKIFDYILKCDFKKEGDIYGYICEGYINYLNFLRAENTKNLENFENLLKNIEEEEKKIKNEIKDHKKKENDIVLIDYSNFNDTYKTVFNDNQNEIENIINIFNSVKNKINLNDYNLNFIK